MNERLRLLRTADLDLSTLRLSRVSASFRYPPATDRVLLFFPCTGAWMQVLGAPPIVCDATSSVTLGPQQIFYRGETGELAFEAIQVELSTRLARRLAGGYAFGPPETWRLVRRPLSLRSYVELARLVRELLTDQSARAHAADRLERLCAQTFSLPAGGPDARRWRAISTRARHARLAEQARAALLVSTRRPSRLGQVAARLGVSPSFLGRVFRFHTGFTPHQYRVQLRLRMAIYPICCSNRPFGEIARDSGFANPSHFSATFKKALGCTPSQLRAN